MKNYARWCGIAFGVIMLALAMAITAETLLRKLFSFSLGGMDELGGYAMAICAPLAFSVALIERSHIRINLFQARMSVTVKALSNAMAMLSLSLLSLYLLYFTLVTLLDTRTYHSVAQTPWATPLVFPQLVWLAGMAIFALAALILAAQAGRLLIRRDWDSLNQRFSPDSLADQLQTELGELAKRKGKPT